MPRLDQLIARSLGCSRARATQLLRRGQVRGVDGERLRDGKLQVAHDRLPFEISVSGAPLTLREHFHLIQHKPVGVVTSTSDPQHPTAWALLEGAPLHAELRAVGRLDLDASGLLVWTTETARIHALTHPKRSVSRTYQVSLARPWTTQWQGLELADGSRPRITALESLVPEEVHPALVTSPETQALARVTVLDGSYHEVKRIFAALGSHVLGLARVAHAGLELPTTLGPGQWVELAAMPEPTRD